MIVYKGLCDTAAKQCTCMMLFEIAYASFRRLDIWKKYDLDIILITGEQLYRNINRTDVLVLMI